MTIQSVGLPAVAGSLLSSVSPNRQPAAPPEPQAPEAQQIEQARRAAQASATQNARSSAEGGNAKPVDREELERALGEVRKVVEPVARNLQFSVDDDTGRTVVKVIDTSTKEVIRQIPSEEILSIAKALDKLKGLLIKQEA